MQIIVFYVLICSNFVYLLFFLFCMDHFYCFTKLSSTFITDNDDEMTIWTKYIIIYRREKEGGRENIRESE